jgi:hypothetical protein
MSIYAAFDPAFRGGVTVGAHAGWSKLAALEVALSSAPGTNEIVVTISRDCVPPIWVLTRRLRTNIDITRADDRGGEVTELSITLHDAIMERDNSSPPSGEESAFAERFRLGYGKMTYSSMPSSSPDVSQAVIASLLRTQTAHHSGGMLVLLGDGSVRHLRPAVRNWSYVVRRPRY